MAVTVSSVCVMACGVLPVMCTIQVRFVLCVCLYVSVTLTLVKFCIYKYTVFTGMLEDPKITHKNKIGAKNILPLIA